MHERPRTVLFVDHSDEIGGAEWSLINLLKHLDRRLWQPRVACPRGDLERELVAHGIPVHILPLPRLRRTAQGPVRLALGARQLAVLAREIDAIILYANTVRSAWYGVAASVLSRTSFVWHMRDFWFSESPPALAWLDSLGKRVICARARTVITNSYAVAAGLPDGSAPRVVHNGVDITQFNPRLSGDEFRHRHHIRPGVRVVGMVGRLRPWKGQTRFLEMAAAIREEIQNTHFVLVGGPSGTCQEGYGDDLFMLAEHLRLSEQVTFTGALEDVRPALAAMDVFVHPGDPEPFGLVNIEAMAMAKPVVALAHGALPEIVEHGRTGLLVPADDPHQLADAVLTLLRNPDRMKALGANGRERAETHFTAERMAREISDILAKVARDGSGRE
jgi:glycosyltransferase involved in cell wall biosynthesis